MNELVLAEFEKIRARDAELWEEGYARIFGLGWSACVACVTLEAQDAIAKGIARCIADGTLTTEAVEQLRASLLDPTVRRVEDELVKVEPGRNPDGSPA